MSKSMVEETPGPKDGLEILRPCVEKLDLPELSSKE
jgi:hypothetical protein